MMNGNYAHPEALVDTNWLMEHRSDSDVRVVEVDVDTAAYDEGHLAGAIAWNWTSQLCDTVRREILSRTQLEELMMESGITPGTTVVLYGDNNNWFAAWAFWQLKIYGHRNARIVDGGRKKLLEEGRALTKDVPRYRRSSYAASEPDLSLRAFLPAVREGSSRRTCALVDVRSPQEFSGEILAPAGLPETCQRGGHIPTAVSVPWSLACNPDGTFKSYAELRALYRESGVDGTQPVIAYCRIGERSSHTWFVLSHLLGYAGVTNYDGSWTEYGNLVGVPIERGTMELARH